MYSTIPDSVDDLTLCLSKCLTQLLCSNQVTCYLPWAPCWVKMSDGIGIQTASVSVFVLELEDWHQSNTLIVEFLSPTFCTVRPQTPGLTLLGWTALLRFSIHLSLSDEDRQEKHLLPVEVVTWNPEKHNTVTTVPLSNRCRIQDIHRLKRGNTLLSYNQCILIYEY